ncbi:MAG: hypothetical protein K9K64_00790 [Desulfohalobiaceae bacterium]|nr:hypothetical protein [Desulfohalobiaceae bacterium]
MGRLEPADPVPIRPGIGPPYVTESFYMLQDLRPSLEEVYYLEGGLQFKEDGSYEIEETE